MIEGVDRKIAPEPYGNENSKNDRYHAVRCMNKVCRSLLKNKKTNLPVKTRKEVMSKHNPKTKEDAQPWERADTAIEFLYEKLEGNCGTKKREKPGNKSKDTRVEKENIDNDSILDQAARTTIRKKPSEIDEKSNTGSFDKTMEVTEKLQEISKGENKLLKDNIKRGARFFNDWLAGSIVGSMVPGGGTAMAMLFGRVAGTSINTKLKVVQREIEGVRQNAFGKITDQQIGDYFKDIAVLTKNNRETILETLLTIKSDLMASINADVQLTKEEKLCFHKYLDFQIDYTMAAIDDKREEKENTKRVK